VVYERFNKRGISLEKHRCGQCQAPLTYLGRFNVDGTASKQRAPSGFPLFVKAHFARVRASMAAAAVAVAPGGRVAHGDVMKELSCQFRSLQMHGTPDAGADADVDAGAAVIDLCGECD
jgi:hypothetical protein